MASDDEMLEGCDGRLRPYACRGSQSRGRRWPEPAHAFRGPFQRDRDRIIHSRAFRRLEYKTQVFLNSAGDHFRTRLTHTMEVTAIARTVARRLAVNEDLTEAISLAHDLGHTPFGHVGERALNEILGTDHGGFDHNMQSLRVVDELEKKYPGIDGLNLSWETRCGLIKRGKGVVPSLDGQPLPPQPSMEAQIADLADDLAYYAHDIDDGLDAGLLDGQRLRQVQLWEMACAEAVANGADPAAGYFATYAIRCLIDMLVGRVIEHTQAQLVTAHPASPQDVCVLPLPLVGFGVEFQSLSHDLRTFLFENLYWHPDVLKVNRYMSDVVHRLFADFLRHPEHLGQGAQARVERDGLHRAIADYIAGMTDRFALSQCELFCLDSGG